MNREATISVVLYKSKTLANGEHPIMLRVSKNGKRKHISLGLSCGEKYWDTNKQYPKRNHPNRLLLEEIIDQKKSEYREKILEFKSESKAYTSHKLTEEVEQPMRMTTVLEYFDEVIEGLKGHGKIGNANAYRDTKNSVIKFRGRNELLFQDIDIRFLKKYEAWFRKKGLKETSMSVYFRTLRALYTRAVEDKIVSEQYYPFKEFKVSKFNTKTSKRAITKEEMYKIFDLELEEFSKIWEAQQYLIFMYYGQGINMKDMALLQWKDIVNDRVHYIRSKTKQPINFKVSSAIKTVLEKFHQLTGDHIGNYVFPVLDKNVHISPQQIDDRVHKINGQMNRQLKEIGKMVGLTVPLSTYAARHTYATVLKFAGADISKISQALGHTNLKTTEIYLKSFEDEEIDKMNEEFL